MADTQGNAILRGVRLHGRLIVTCLIGSAAGLALPGAWGLSTRVLTGWAVMIALYMALTAFTFWRCDLKRLKARAAADDEGAAFIVFLCALSALASLGAIVIELGIAKAVAETRVWHMSLAIATILLSWWFIHLIFAQHYAHQYYGDAGTHQGGLDFPGDKNPDHWDFLYFSLVIGMTAQVSDVQITKPHVRRTATAHGVVSFFFNTAIIALLVNIAASAL